MFQVVTRGISVGAVIGLVYASAPVLAADDGYAGLIAPSKPAEQQSISEPQEPAGYSGLVPGRSAAPSAPEPAPQTTSAPSVAAPQAVDTAKLKGAIRAQDRDGDGVPDQVAPVFQADDKMKRLLSQPRQRIDGMLPEEYAVRMDIDKWMSRVRDKNLSPEERSKNTVLARERLSELANAFRLKMKTPPETYLRMGLPEVFIKEEREGASKALPLLDGALKELKSIK